MSYIHKPNMQPLEHRTAFQLLHAHAQAQPCKEAVVFRNVDGRRRAITFKEYQEKSEVLAAALLKLGLVRGDRVLLLLPTSEEFLFIHMALTIIGVLVVVREQEAYSAIYDIKDLACVVASIVGNVSPNTDNMVHKLCKIFQQGTLKAGIIVGHSADTDELLDNKGVYSYDKLFEMINEESSTKVKHVEAKVQFDDPALVLFTSGSTGIPKPIQFTHQAFINGAWSNAHSMAADKDTILFCDGPFDWISGMGLGISVVLLLGSTFVSFPPRLAFKGGYTTAIMKVLEEEKCSHAILLLYILQDMISCDEIHSTDLSQLKYCLTGGQPTSSTLFKKLFSMLPQLLIRNIYGSTETGGIALQEITKHSLDSLNFGLMEICQGLEVKITDEDGHLVPVNTPGEVCVRANWVCFMNPDLTKSSLKELAPNFPQDVSLRWHHTKDLALIIPEGKMMWIGRMDNLIKCASDSIQPNEVEDVIMKHPGVAKVIAVGVPDERLYNKICACIIMKAGHQDNTEVLHSKFEEWCKDKFPKSSIGILLKPHYFVFFKGFPLTRTGKLNRKLLKELAAKELGLLGKGKGE